MSSQSPVWRARLWHSFATCLPSLRPQTWSFAARGLVPYRSWLPQASPRFWCLFLLPPTTIRRATRKRWSAAAQPAWCATQSLPANGFSPACRSWPPPRASWNGWGNRRVTLRGRERRHGPPKFWRSWLPFGPDRWLLFYLTVWFLA